MVSQPLEEVVSLYYRLVDRAIDNDLHLQMDKVNFIRTFDGWEFYEDGDEYKKNEEESRLRNNERCVMIKEELMMNRWHPTRVEKLILLGYDVEDM